MQQIMTLFFNFSANPFDGGRSVWRLLSQIPYPGEASVYHGRRSCVSGTDNPPEGLQVFSSFCCKLPAGPEVNNLFPVPTQVPCDMLETHMPLQNICCPISTLIFPLKIFRRKDYFPVLYCFVKKEIIPCTAGFGSEKWVIIATG